MKIIYLYFILFGMCLNIYSQNTCIYGDSYPNLGTIPASTFQTSQDYIYRYNDRNNIQKIDPVTNRIIGEFPLSGSLCENDLEDIVDFTIDEVGKTLLTSTGYIYNTETYELVDSLDFFPNSKEWYFFTNYQCSEGKNLGVLLDPQDSIKIIVKNEETVLLDTVFTEMIESITLMGDYLAYLDESSILHVLNIQDKTTFVLENQYFAKINSIGNNLLLLTGFSNNDYNIIFDLQEKSEMVSLKNMDGIYASVEDNYIYFFQRDPNIMTTESHFIRHNLTNHNETELFTVITYIVPNRDNISFVKNNNTIIYSSIGITKVYDLTTQSETLLSPLTRNVFDVNLFDNYLASYHLGYAGYYCRIVDMQKNEIVIRFSSDYDAIIRGNAVAITSNYIYFTCSRNDSILVEIYDKSSYQLQKSDGYIGNTSYFNLINDNAYLVIDSTQIIQYYNNLTTTPTTKEFDESILDCSAYQNQLVVLSLSEDEQLSLTMCSLYDVSTELSKKSGELYKNSNHNYYAWDTNSVIADAPYLSYTTMLDVKEGDSEGSLTTSDDHGFCYMKNKNKIIHLLEDGRVYILDLNSNKTEEEEYQYSTNYMQSIPVKKLTYCNIFENGNSIYFLDFYGDLIIINIDDTGVIEGQYVPSGILIKDNTVYTDQSFDEIKIHLLTGQLVSHRKYNIPMTSDKLDPNQNNYLIYSLFNHGELVHQFIMNRGAVKYVF